MSFEKCIKKVKGMEVVMAVEVMVVVVFCYNSLQFTKDLP